MSTPPFSPTPNSARSIPEPQKPSPEADEHKLLKHIRRYTRRVAVPLVPELKLHLITEDSELWLANEEQARKAGLEMPFWAFAWPGGQALARHLLDNPHLVSGKSVLDFGSGSAIEGLAALKAGAHKVLAADIDPVAGLAARLNGEINGLNSLETSTENLVGQELDFDVVLAGDVFYDPEFASQSLQWLQKLARRGTTVLIGDPSRGFLNTATLRKIATYPATHDGELDPEKTRDTEIYRLSRTLEPDSPASQPGAD